MAIFKQLIFVFSWSWTVERHFSVTTGWEASKLKWLSGDPMEYTNWCEGCLDEPEGWDYLQLLRQGYPYFGTLDTFYWARSVGNNGDNGVICEIDMDK